MIPGKHIVLRAVEREDLPNYVQWLNDPRILDYFGSMVPLSLPMEERWYEQMLQDPSTRALSVHYDGRHVGGAGFVNIEPRNRSAEVGLFIGLPELWDQGLGRDVLQTLLGFGFQQMNLHRQYLRVFAGNERGIHLYETAGFQHEGCWRQAEYRHGRYHDLVWMGILRDEWASLRGS